MAESRGEGATLCCLRCHWVILMPQVVLKHRPRENALYFMDGESMAQSSSVANNVHSTDLPKLTEQMGKWDINSLIFRYMVARQESSPHL